MGIKDILEDAAGAYAAVKGLEAVDPDANLLEKAGAAFVGVEGAGMLRDALGNLIGGQEAPAEAAPAADTSFDDSQTA